MKLSTRARYGVRAMLELALHYGDGYVLVKDIAKNQEISRRYLEHLIVSLNAAGLVKTIRGKKGGCILAKHPSEIKLGEIVEALEGSLVPVDCVPDSKICSRERFCAVRDIWIKMRETIINLLNSVTLEELAKRQREKSKRTETPIYYI